MPEYIFRDYNGDEVKIGDQIIYASTKVAVELRMGKIKNFQNDNHRIWIETANKPYPMALISRYGNEVVKTCPLK